MSQYSLVENSTLKPELITEFKSKIANQVNFNGPSTVTYIALKDKLLIGQIEVKLSIIENQSVAIIYNFYVESEHESRGVGNGLLLRAEHYATEHKHNKIYLLVTKHTKYLLTDFFQKRRFELITKNEITIFSFIDNIDNFVIYGKQ